MNETEENAMKLKLFEINNLFNQFNVRLPLNEKVNIFLGENGMGKTTILNCLYYVLSGNVERLNNIIFDDISLTFIDGERLCINHNDLSSYVEDYMYDNPPYRRRRVRFESLFSLKELEIINKLIEEGSNEDELKKYYLKVSDIFGMPPSMARRELERYVLQRYRKNNTTKVDFNNVIEFKKKVDEKIDEEILYFPTYRRIEEDMSNLGIDIEKDRVKNRLIQFGMTDVEKNIDTLLQTIKSVAITGFAKMTGVLLKQYLNGELSDFENYKALSLVEKNSDESLVAKAFFVDSDFDTTKYSNPILYQTSCYSIENFYTSKEAFSKILNREFGINTTEKDYLKCCSDYSERQREFHDETIYINSWLSCQRLEEEFSEDHKIVLSDFKISKLFSEITIDNIIPKEKINREKIQELFPNSMNVEECEIEGKINYFKNGDMGSLFRGKFEIEFLKKIIDSLRIKNKAGGYFSKKYTSVHIDPNINTLSTLEDYADTPQSLIDFLKQYRTA